jgi:mono/diheme cytochrome c family protein
MQSMNRHIAPVCGLAAALTLAMMSVSAAAESRDVAAGRGIAEQRCGECHVVAAGSGGGWTNAPSFAQVANRPQTSTAWLTHFIPQQHAHMLNYKFSESQLRQISAYIMSLRQK